MNYYLDTEFDGFGGPLLSLALIREDGASLYVVLHEAAAKDQWVRENVLSVMRAVPVEVDIVNCERNGAAIRIANFLHGDPHPHIHADWPDDVRHFCRLVVVGPGQMVNIPHLSFEVHRVDAYPTDLPGAIRHNAWWDAMALRHTLMPRGSR
jgi:hypothetical protein